MPRYNARKLTGPWTSGYALDMHTGSSVLIGYDEYGRAQFETTYSEIGVLLNRLKYHNDKSTVFIGGSRRISRLNDMIRERLDLIVNKKLQVLLGDANGADKAVQAYLDKQVCKTVCTAAHVSVNLNVTVS